MRLLDQLGLEVVLGGVYISSGPYERWHFGNPLLRVEFGARFEALELRASTGLAASVARTGGDTSSALHARFGLASAALRSGTRDLWQWAPKATSWLSTVRLQQTVDVVTLGLNGQGLLMVQQTARGGGALSADVTIALFRMLELGFELQTAGMLSKAWTSQSARCTDITIENVFCSWADRVLEDDGLYLAGAAWLGLSLDFFRATVRVSATLAQPALGASTARGFLGTDVSLGLVF